MQNEDAVVPEEATAETATDASPDEHSSDASPQSEDQPEQQPKSKPNKILNKKTSFAPDVEIEPSLKGSSFGASAHPSDNLGNDDSAHSSSYVAQMGTRRPPSRQPSRGEAFGNHDSCHGDSYIDKSKKPPSRLPSRSEAVPRPTPPPKKRKKQPSSGIPGAPEDMDDVKYCQFMTGISGDIKGRAPYYAGDWCTRPKSIFTIVNAIIFAFVVQLIPALIFAELMDRETQGQLAAAETLLSAGIIGIIYAIMSGQPLVLLGITGPVAILLGTSYGLAEQFESDYWPFFWWLCMWTALMHWITAMSGIVNFVWHITPFASGIFEFFIAMSFIYESIRDLVEPLHLRDGSDLKERSAAYASLVLGMLAFILCWSLHHAETWMYFTRQVRTFLSSYNMAIATIIVTGLSYLPGADQSATGYGIERVHVTAPWDWQPTGVGADGERRSWVTNPLEGIGYKGIFGALFPAFMLYLLFFIDHNISSILTQSPKYNLKKPAAYHWDFFCLGVTIVPCGILGLPPGSGLIPQAPLHTRALATRKHVEMHGVKREITVHVEEQRWSALIQAALMFVALSLMIVISWIPKSALFGVFLYLGVGAMHGNEIWRNINLCFMLGKKRPPLPLVKNVKWRTVQLYTAFQVLCALIIFAIAQFAPVGYIFPALVTALVPIRSWIVSRMFREEDLTYLDPIGETEEELHEEREMYFEHRRSSIDSVDAMLPGFAEFHAEGIQHDLKEHNKSMHKHTDDDIEAAEYTTDAFGIRQRKK